MATEKQIAANRRNAKKSTGPKTHEGKLRSRKNAVRHGLTAETVVSVFENAEEYSALERAILADYDPKTAIEYQLVIRLASLLWRLRRAVAVESGILNINGQVIRERTFETQRISEADPIAVFRRFLATGPGNGQTEQEINDHQTNVQAFIRLGIGERGILELILRYETTLSRQLIQTIICLSSCRRDLGTKALSPKILKMLDENRSKRTAAKYNETQVGKPVGIASPFRTK